MAESTEQISTRTRPVPWGLLGMVVLVALGEGFVGRLEPSITGVEPWDWRRTGHAASGSPEVREASILCFGDSLVKLGVQPRVIQEVLGGRRAYSLALCAGRAPSSYFLLRRALESGVKPKALVVDFNDSFLAEPPETTLRLYSEILRPDEARELARTMGHPDFASTVLTFQGLRTAKNRFEIRRAIVDSLLGKADFARKRAVSTALRKNWKANLGAQVMPKAATVLPDDPAAWAWVQPSGWLPDPTNAAYLSAFFELAEAHEIPAFWLLPPLHPGFTSRRLELGLDAAFDAFVARTLAKFPRVVVVDGRGAKYDASLFIDMAHLDLDGSRRLSLALASVMAEALARPGPRIVTLPPALARQVAAGGAPTAR